MKIFLQFMKPVLGISIAVLIVAVFIWRDQWMPLSDQKQPIWG